MLGRAYWRRNVLYRWHDLQEKNLKLGGVMLFCLDGLDDVDVDLDASLESLILLYIAYSLWLHLYGTNLRHGFSL
jgi:hypothetical protein